ncbi:hypothetical protein K8354_07800 [Polaribacter litorisediminis]|uniref:hypothetical protein n=1 Tax=Polaribacter litorisediminis TaxID=1908341 RepID=UPI001CBC2816|nr:hypothetical protein [Polaribacter litorisediminis]UAM99697.1 hypothetical protein K8354_07800 [Polaribacter litorisediminis]
MKTDTLKQTALFLVCVIGLTYSGYNLITSTSITSLLDMLNLIVFFACFFPSLILLVNLSTKILKAFTKPETRQI